MDEKSFIKKLYNQHRNTRPGIHLSTVGALANGLMKLIFPALCDKVYENEDDFAVDFLKIKTDLFQILKKLPSPKSPIGEIQRKFIDSLPVLMEELLCNCHLSNCAPFLFFGNGLSPKNANGICAYQNWD